MANESKSRVDIELRVQADRALADIRRAEAPVRRAAADLERRVSVGLGAGAANSFAAGVGAGGGKAAAAKLAGVAAIIAAVDTSLSQFAGAFKAPENRNRGFLPTAFEGAQAAAGGVLLEMPVVGKAMDAIAAAIDHARGTAPGAGWLDSFNKDRQFIRNRAESVRALGEPAGPDRFGASTPFGAFIGGGAQTSEATTLLRQIAEATRQTALSNRAMEKDSSGFR